ncbi:response regulator transcription factor [Pseudoduganella ginsengisoli]|uniref:Response regulator n=1 Tax=Pseudoduganella ginsengisoli TaxID=1462440 RepID=A0A6L6Q9C6_9BURK|nr:response regulator transcription factor [Pseudoduganella ginsengisoli]MTW06250.1 response regulator [Pseudoduganella ginsengisoli]
MRLLIIEDNPDIVANLYEFLEPRGYVLDSAPNGYTGLGLATQHQYDAVVLDVMLPGLNGVELCQKLRNELHNSTPVIMLTARDTLSDKSAGFDAGADDYLVKPFSLLELEMRIKALVRRARGMGQGATVLRVGDLTFDTSTYTATRAGKPLALTRTGFVLLRCLMREAPRLVSRDTLEHEVWGEDRPDSDALRTHLHALRQALDKPFPFAMLRTVPGIGYKLLSPGDDAAGMP